MAEKKFRFVSPGIFVNEIDNSQLPNDLPDVGPIIIGRADHGPGLRPIRVNSPSEFIEFYGNPIPGGRGEDVWRDGNYTGPTYGAYAALAYLRAGVGPINYVRLLGAQSPDATSGNEAGWMGPGDSAAAATHGNSNGAFGLFLFKSASAGHTKDIGEGRLAAVFYGSSSYFELSGATIASTTTDQGQLALIESVATGPEFKMVISSSENTSYTTNFNFDRNSSKYIRKVFNTNPQLLNGRATTHTAPSTVIPSSSNTYFLGETFERFAVTDHIGSNEAFGIVVPLAKGLTAAGNYAYKRRGFADGQSGMVFSQNVSTNYSSFDAQSDTTNLFKFTALNHAEWASKKLKVSITDIKASANDVDAYGTFTVQVRLASDTDNAPQIVEQFTNCNLNPASENYVAKKVGDKYVQYDTTQRRLREYGEFNNQSKYIYITVESIVSDGNADPSLLPFGFYGPPRPRSFTIISGSTATFASGAAPANGEPDSAPTAMITTYATGGAGLIEDLTRTDGTKVRPDGLDTGEANTFFGTPAGTTNLTASFKFPTIALRTNALDGGISDPKKAYFGIQPTLSSTSLRHDPGYVDYVRPAPGDSDVYAATGTNTGSFEYAFIFTLDDISGSAGVHASGSSTGAEYLAGRGSLNASGSSYQTVLDSGFNSFTMPLWGGHNGIDIGEQEPFNNVAIGSSPTEETNYAYYSVKRAIDVVSDPELVEANMISAPGITQPIITDQILALAEGRGDCLAVIDIENVYTPKTESTESYQSRVGSVSTAVSGLQNRRINTSYGCTFYPWVRVRDDISNASLWVPPSVIAIGTFASSEARSELWFAPAGFTRGGLSTGAGGFPVLNTTERLRREDRDDLYEVNINPIATFPSEGIVIFGQKTLQVTPSALDRINVRRLLIFLKKRISRIAAGILFDQNVNTTWLRFKTEADKFLGSVQARLGLTEFKVVLDKSTTTDDLVDRNILYAKIFLKPARAIEFIAIDFVITRSGASFDD